MDPVPVQKVLVNIVNMQMMLVNMVAVDDFLVLEFQKKVDVSKKMFQLFKKILKS